MGSSTNLTDQLRLALADLRAKALEAGAAGPTAAAGPAPHEQPPVQAHREVRYTNGDTYKGDMLGDQRHGQGTHVSSNGDVYHGAWRLDKRHGRGRFTAPGRVSYEGQWQDDKAHGHGACTYADGGTYEGDWHQDARQGWGSHVSRDGARYEGEWHHDTMHGQGEWRSGDGRSCYFGRYVDGAVSQGKLLLQGGPGQPSVEYHGQFLRGVCHGQGMQVVQGAYQYVGGWREGQRSGEGTCTFADGSCYRGGWRRDVYHGRGCLEGPDGSSYEGQWEEGKQQGQGRCRSSSGDRYVGGWQQGERSGQGRCAFASGDTYVGQWAADRPHGQGTCKYGNGDRYQGQWEAGARHGHGLMVWAEDGAHFRGRWERGAWLQPAADPARCRLSGAGLTRATAGQLAVFELQAYDEDGNRRLSGGDAFKVVLLHQGAGCSAPCDVPPADLGALQGARNSSSSSSSRKSSSNGSSDLNAGDDPLGCCTPPTTPATPASPHCCSPCGTPAAAPAAAAAGAQNPARPGALQGSAAPALARGAAGPSSPAADEDPAECRAVGDRQLPSSCHGPGGLLQPAVDAVEGAVVDRQDGCYSCSYSLSVAGTYLLYVVTDDEGDAEAVGDSPYRVVVLPGPPCPARCTAEGEGLRRAVAGEAASFTLTARDACGNACQHLTQQELRELLPAQGELRLNSKVVPVACSPRSGGVYSCSYMPDAEGMGVLQLLAAERHLRGSPSSVAVAAPSSLPAAAAQAREGGAAPGGAGAAASVQDLVGWWGAVAQEAYEAVDGSLAGFAEGGAAEEGARKTPEQLYAEQHPHVPVVERLEDLWLLQKLQQERERRQQALGPAPRSTS